jgi:hypothetical protein
MWLITTKSRKSGTQKAKWELSFRTRIQLYLAEKRGGRSFQANETEGNRQMKQKANKTDFIFFVPELLSIMDFGLPAPTDRMIVPIFGRDKGKLIACVGYVCVTG